MIGGEEDKQNSHSNLYSAVFDINKITCEVQYSVSFSVANES